MGRKNILEGSRKIAHGELSCKRGRVEDSGGSMALQSIQGIKIHGGVVGDAAGKTGTVDP